MASSQSKVKVFIGAVALAASGAIATTIPATAEVLHDRTGEVAAVLALTLALQLVTLRHPGKGSIGFASAGLVLAAVALGAGPAMIIGAVAGFVHWVRTRGLLHRAVFDAANMATAAGAAAGVYQLLGGGVADFAAATAAAGVYVALNHALLCMAMSLSESRSPRAVWHERFHWARYYLAGFAPVAGILTLGDHHVRMGVGLALALCVVQLVQMRRDAGAAHAAHARP